MFGSKGDHLLCFVPILLSPPLCSYTFLVLAQAAQIKIKKILSALSGTEDFSNLVYFGVMEYRKLQRPTPRFELETCCLRNTLLQLSPCFLCYTHSNHE